MKKLAALLLIVGKKKNKAVGQTSSIGTKFCSMYASTCFLYHHLLDADFAWSNLQDHM